MQIVFGCGTIMNLTFDDNWHLIKQCKQNLINQSNAKENSKGVDHTYKVDDLVIIKNKQLTKYGKDNYNCPWTIQEVQDNRTINISKGLVSIKTNIYFRWNKLILQRTP